MMKMEACAILSGLLVMSSALKDVKNISQFDVEHRIFAGKDAPLTDFPWAVKIISYHWGLLQVSWAAKCTGTYIHEWWVLSAASCVMSDRTNIPPEPYYLVELYMGFTQTAGVPIQKRKAAEYSVHPAYIREPTGSMRIFGHNLVLIRPETRFKFSDRVQVDKNWDKAPGTTGRQSCIVGFGLGKPRTSPLELQRAPINNFEKDVKSIKNKVKDLYLLKNIVICYGDIGGPLYWGVAQVGVATRYQHKLTSPDECGTARYINIRNSEVYSWLTGQIKKSIRISGGAKSKNDISSYDLLGLKLLFPFLILKLF